MSEQISNEFTAPDGNSSFLDVPIDRIDTRRYPGAFSADKPPPYAYSPLSGSTIEQDMRDNPKALFNGRLPHYAIQHERFEHRVVCFLKAEGLSNKEIAERSGLSPVAVSNIVRQPWAQQEILRIIHENGNDTVQSLLQGAAADAVSRLITEMDNDLARPSERIQAADKLLDRLYGKPNQPIEHKVGELSHLSDKELEDIVKSGSTCQGGTVTASTSER